MYPYDHYYRQDRLGYELLGELERQYERAREMIYQRELDYLYHNPIYYISKQTYPWDPQPYKYTYSYLNSATGEMSMPLVSPTETKKFIIISSAGAAEHPTDHKTLAEAEAEATRLAKQFPKQEFTVYETKKSFKVADKPVDVKFYA